MPWPTHATRAAAVAAIMLVVVSGCAGAEGSAPPPAASSTASATIVTTTAPTATLAPTLAAPPTPGGPTPYPTQTTFVSPLYGFSVSVPAGWTVVPATDRWDGASPVGHDDPIVDQLLPPKVPNRCTGIGLCAPNAWAFATKSELTLDAWVKAVNAADHADHPCAAEPETSAQIRIDGVPAILQSRHCEPVTGILVLNALVVAHGNAYAFYMQDQSGEHALDAQVRAELVAMLATIDLP